MSDWEDRLKRVTERLNESGKLNDDGALKAQKEAARTKFVLVRDATSDAIAKFNESTVKASNLRARLGRWTEPVEVQVKVSNGREDVVPTLRIDVEAMPNDRAEAREFILSGIVEHLDEHA